MDKVTVETNETEELKGQLQNLLDALLIPLDRKLNAEMQPQIEAVEAELPAGALKIYSRLSDLHLRWRTEAMDRAFAFGLRLGTTCLGELVERTF